MKSRKITTELTLVDAAKHAAHRLSAESNTARRHLVEHAAERPEIGGVARDAVRREQLGRDVAKAALHQPRRRRVGGAHHVAVLVHHDSCRTVCGERRTTGAAVVPGRRAALETNCLREAKLAEFHHAILVEEHRGGLHVAEHHAARVEVAQAAEDVEAEAANGGGRHAAVGSEERAEIATGAELEHDPDVPRRLVPVYEPKNMRMCKVREELDFMVHEVEVAALQLLRGNELHCAVLPRLVDERVPTVRYFFNDVELIHTNRYRVRERRVGGRNERESTVGAVNAHAAPLATHPVR